MRRISEDRLSSALHVHLYALAWLGYFVLLLVLPIRYGSLQAFNAGASLTLWVIASLSTAYGIHFAFITKSQSILFGPLSSSRPLRRTELERLVWISLGLSIFGFLCLLFDRIVIQGVDFSQGIAVARNLWAQSGEQRDGVSSIFSVFGYFFGFTFFVATTVAHLHWEFLRRHSRWGVVAISGLLIAANSLLTGGRSIILVQLAAIVSVCGIRSMLGLSMWPGRGARIWLGAFLAFVLAFGYALYVFSERAKANNIEPEPYVVGMLTYLGAEVTDEFYDLEALPGPIAATGQFATVAGAYLTHSFGTFESILEMHDSPANVTFIYLRQLLAKVGLMPQDTEEWSLSGRFLSLPGSLWYDFGWLGFFGGAFILGSLLGFSTCLIRSRNGGGVSVAAVLMIGVMCLLSPLLLAADILCVPFVVIAFLLLDGVSRTLWGARNWLYVSQPMHSAELVCAPEAVAPILRRP